MKTTRGIQYIDKEGVLHSNPNIVNGSGSSSLNQVQDGTTGTFDFTNKNLNATAIDNTLTGNIPYGGTGEFAVAFNGKSSAQGKRSFTSGTTTIAKGNYSFATGDNSVALAVASFAEGGTTTAAGLHSHSEGGYTVAGGDNSHAEGEFTVAKAYGSHAEGHNTKSLNELAVSSSSGDTGGGDTPSKTPDDTLGGYSHVQGDNTWSLGYASHSEGVGTRAWGHFSHAEGLNTISGKLVAEGSYYKVQGKATHSEGYKAIAEGDFSHAEGLYSYAGGYGSHAEGENTKTTGKASHTNGLRTIAGYEYQLISGKYNKNKSNTLFEVGNGTSDTDRKNAFEVLVDGRAKVQTAPSEDDDIVRYSEALTFRKGTYQGSWSIDPDEIGLKWSRLSWVGNGSTSTVPTSFTLDMGGSLVFNGTEFNFNLKMTESITLSGGKAPIVDVVGYSNGFTFYLVFSNMALVTSLDVDGNYSYSLNSGKVEAKVKFGPVSIEGVTFTGPIIESLGGIEGDSFVKVVEVTKSGQLRPIIDPFTSTVVKMEPYGGGDDSMTAVFSFNQSYSGSTTATTTPNFDLNLIGIIFEGHRFE